jgi:hypothetical protein
MARYFFAVATILLAVAASTSTAGNNQGARVWLSWDRPGLQAAYYSALLDSASLYCQVDGASDIVNIAIQLEYESTDESHHFDVVDASPSTQYGWVARAAGAGTVFGDTTYDWVTAFPTPALRSRVEFKIGVSTPGDTASGSAWLSQVILQDSSGQLDTATVIGGATVRYVEAPIEPTAPGEPVPGVVLLQLPTGSLTGATVNSLRVVQSDIQQSSVASVLAAVGFTGALRIFPTAIPGNTVATTYEGDQITIPDFSNWYVASVDPAIPVASVISTLQTVLDSSAVHPSRALMAHVADPNDPEYPLQWHLLPEANGSRVRSGWDLSQGDPSIWITMLDSGWNLGHHDLDPGNRSHVVVGFDTAELDADISDNAKGTAHGHGMGVAGIAGALTDNQLGVSGIGWNCKLMLYKTVLTILNWSFNPDWAVARAIHEGLARSPKVFSMSFGIPFDHPSEVIYRELVGSNPLGIATYTAFRVGAVLAASSGNDNTSVPNLPAAYPWVMSVGASDENGRRVVTPQWGSNYGQALDVIAPGNFIRTLDIGDGTTQWFAGTSAAAPVVAGMAGLVWSESASQQLGLTNEDVINLIQRGARDVPDTGVGKDDQTGWGIADAPRTLALLQAPYHLERGSFIGGVATLTQDNHERNFIGNGGLPGGQYRDVKQYEVRQHVAFCAPAVEAPLVWARTRQSRGWSQGNANEELPFAEVLNVTNDGFDLRTFVYFVGKDILGRVVNQWWPCTPENAVTAYTAAVRTPLSGLSLVGPTSACAGRWNAVTCGGDQVVTYEWFARTAGQPWAGPISTAASLEWALSYGQNAEVKVVVNCGSVVLSDSLAVSYAPCTVDVTEPNRDERLKVFGGLWAGAGNLRLEVPGPGDVSVALLDIAGRIVWQTTSSSDAAGERNLRVDRTALGVASGPGVYLALVRWNGQQATAKVVLLR